MLVVSDDFKFGVLWEVYEQSDDESWTFGMVRLIIDGEIFPKKQGLMIPLMLFFII